MCHQSMAGSSDVVLRPGLGLETVSRPVLAGLGLGLEPQSLGLGLGHQGLGCQLTQDQSRPWKIKLQ